MSVDNQMGAVSAGEIPFGESGSDTGSGAPPSQTAKVDKHEIEKLYKRHIGPLARLLRKMFGDGPPEPEDIAHLAFQKLLERQETTPIRNLEAFLWRTARNLFLNEHRAREVRSRYDYELEQLYFAERGSTLEPERVVSARVQIKAIQKIVAQMTAPRRQAFILHHVDGLKAAEVAREMGISRTATVNHLARAFAQIDAAL